jgi:hypothetical protein
MSTRVRSDAGAEATLNEFFRLCAEAGPSGCAIWRGDPAARFDAIADQVLETPVEIPDPFTGEPFLLTYAQLIAFMSDALYDSFNWALAAQVLAYIEDQIAAPAGQVRLDAPAGTTLGRPAARYPNFVEGGVGVFC